MRSLIGGLLAAAILMPYTAASLQKSGGQIPLQPARDGDRKVDSTATNTAVPLSDETKSLLDLHRSLVEIESISGNEHAVGVFLADYLKSKGFHVEKQEVPRLEQNPVDAPRFNVYAYKNDSNGRASGRSGSVLVTSHMDTVPPFYNYSFDAGSFDIGGRGSVDAKGSVAAQITATLSLLEAGEIGAADVALLFVVGEEVAGDGMKAANRLGLKWRAGIFGEPTELKLAAGHKGILALTMRARGKSAHSGYPWLGIDANRRLIRAMAALEDLDLGASDKYGNTTINIGRIRGGAAGNVVSDFAEALIQVRLAVADPVAARRKIEAAAGEDVELTFHGGYGPVDCDADVDGFDTITVNYGTDVPNLERHRLGKRYLYGPGTIFVAHGDHEHLNVRDLEEAVKGYKNLIKHALKS